MKWVVFAVIALIAGIVGYFALVPDCRGARVSDATQCARIAGFDQAFCHQAFERQSDAIRRGTLYRTHAECSARNVQCMEFPGLSGWTPKPQAYCITRSADGGLATMLPLYDRAR